MVSSNTPPASSAPSPISFTFHALAGRRRSAALSLVTCCAICVKIGRHFFPLSTVTQAALTAYNVHSIMSTHPTRQVRRFSQCHNPTPHFWGCAPRGAMMPNSNSAETFVQCTYPQVSSSYAYSFGSYCVDK